MVATPVLTDAEEADLKALIDERALEAVQEEEADLLYHCHAFSTANRIAQEVAEYVDHQFVKYPAQRLTGLGWIALVTDEWGETVQAYLKQDHEQVVKEGKQAIASIMRLIVESERERRGLAVTESLRYTDPV